MKPKLFVLILVGALLALVMLNATGALAQGPNPRAPHTALGTAFTYQGQLKSGGSPYNGSCDFQFKLYDDATVGAQIGATQTATSVSVVSGLFATQIDFGAGAFNGSARWIDIGVKCGSETLFTPLTARQPLTPAPYALALPGLYTQHNATSPNLIGGYIGNSVTSGIHGATIGGGGFTGNINRITDSYGTVGGGATNQAGDNSGTYSDKPYATVGGGLGNTASGTGAFVGGGGHDGITPGGNTASGGASTVGGGLSNTASGYYTTVGGGSSNTASNHFATVSGGYMNAAYSERATVGGGDTNQAGGLYATIGGGRGNATGSSYATVPGGYSASASHWGEMAYASGGFAATGDAQTSTYVLRHTTANATATELFLDGSIANSRITIAPGRTIVFDILIVGRRDSSNQSAGYHFRGVIKNDTGTPALIGAAEKTVLGENDPAWDANVTADTTNDALKITVTGVASTTIRWVATVRTVEVAW